MSGAALVTLLVSLVLTASSCGGGEDDATAAAQLPTGTAVTETAAEPAATVSPTPTAAPSPTPESSGEMAGLEATPTPKPVAIASATPAAKPSPTTHPTLSPTEEPEATPTPAPEPTPVATPASAPVPMERPPLVLPAAVPEWPRDVLPNSDPAKAIPTILSSALLDKNGVVLVDYRERFGGAGVQYNPQSVGYIAQILFASISEGHEELKDEFLTQVNWLVNNARERDGFVTWIYDFANPGFDAPAPWTSGMAHGRILTALIQAHYLTGDEEYLETAEASLGAFEVSMAEGGVRTESDDFAGAWYEEVAGPEVASSKILNGHIFALVGLRDYALYTGSQRAWELYIDGELAVADLLTLFDAGHISRYDLAGHSWCKYNLVHVRQMNWLADVTGRELYGEYADRFARYQEALGECA